MTVLNELSLKKTKSFNPKKLFDTIKLQQFNEILRTITISLSDTSDKRVTNNKRLEKLVLGLNDSAGYQGLVKLSKVHSIKRAHGLLQ